MNVTPNSGLSVRTHRGIVILLAVAGFFGGAAVGAVWFGQFGAVIGGAVGSTILMQLSRFLIPAKCPECASRVRVRFVMKSSPTDAGTGISIQYNCGACGFEFPHRVATRADVAQFGDSTARLATIVRSGFTIVGGFIVMVAGGLTIDRLLRGDFRTMGIALGAMVFGIVWIVLARSLISSFLRRAGQMLQQIAAQASLGAFTPMEGIADGVPFRAEPSPPGSVTIAIDLPQRQMHLPSQAFNTNHQAFDANGADWGAKPIKSLFDLGASSVDVGSQGDGVYVVFPQDRVNVTRELVLSAASLMVTLRRLAMGEPE